jgi:hypothetical protein
MKVGPVNSESEYFKQRAQREFDLAQKARNDSDARVHYGLANRYMEMAQPELMPPPAGQHPTAALSSSVKPR